MSVTHLAGPVIVIGERVIQRCPVCGEKLLDNLNEKAPCGEDGAPAQAWTWDERHLVRFDGPSSVDVGDFLDDRPLPADFCLPLVEL